MFPTLLLLLLGGLDQFSFPCLSFPPFCEDAVDNTELWIIRPFGFNEILYVYPSVGGELGLSCKLEKSHSFPVIHHTGLVAFGVDKGKVSHLSVSLLPEVRIALAGHRRETLSFSCHNINLEKEQLCCPPCIQLHAVPYARPCSHIWFALVPFQRQRWRSGLQ